MCWKNVRLRITALKIEKGRYLGLREEKKFSKEYGAVKGSA